MKIKEVPLIALKRDAMSKNIFLGEKKKKTVRIAGAFMEKVRQRSMVLLSKVYSKAVTSLKSKTSLVKVFIIARTAV